ncbi:MAG TPA: AI-2E family transporter [Methylomirabilota bacterium]|nr:AI-2E family transporter [Methylomirabilota bacterium]
MKDRPVELVTWGAISRVVLAGIGVWVLVETWQLWVLLFLALVVAAAILPAARWGDRHRIPRLVTVAGVYLAAALVVSALGRFLVPAFLEEGRQFAAQLPALVDKGRALLAALVAWGARWDIPLPGLSEDGESLKRIGEVLVQNTLLVTKGAIGAVVAFFLVLVVAAYLVIDAERVGRGLGAFLPASRRALAVEVAARVLAVMGGYVRGQAVVSLAVGTVIAVGLAVLGVPYALLIGGAAAVLNVVPFLGSPAAAVLGILAALNISIGLAVWAALVFWGANLLEAKLFVPQLVGRATGLHPLAVMIGILVGAKLAGIIGALIAVPFLAGAWEVGRALYIEPREQR